MLTHEYERESNARRGPLKSGRSAKDARLGYILDRGSSGRIGRALSPLLLRSPEFMSRLQRAGEYLRFESRLPGNMRELIILFTARKWTQRFERDSHAPLALKEGLKPESLAALSEGRRPSAMTDDEETAYQFCVELL